MSKLHSGKPGGARSGWVPPEKIEDERFGRLMAWLVFLIFIWIVGISRLLIDYGPYMSILKTLAAFAVALGVESDIPLDWLLPISVTFQAMLILMGFSLLMRQKWGLYGLVAVYLGAVVIDIAIGSFGIDTIIRALLVPGITTAFAVPVWRYLE
jgi:hypothetical protein